MKAFRGTAEDIRQLCSVKGDEDDNLDDYNFVGPNCPLRLSKARKDTPIPWPKEYWDEIDYEDL